MNNFTRRDFLKWMTAMPLGHTLSTRIKLAAGSQPNIIILLFDAMSAYDLSVYGYPRKTTPNLERFAQRADVYHAHYSTANFTVPGTSSLLTGLHPWTHRALHLSGLVARKLAGQNIFKEFGGTRHRFAFSQNLMTTNLLNQFRADIDELLETSAFSEYSLIPSEYAPQDPITAHETDDNLLFDFVDPPGSLLFGIFQRVYFEWLKESGRVPAAIPQPRNYPLVYKLWQVFEGVKEALDEMPAPHFSYIHFFSPHAPYRAIKKFQGIFDESWQPIRKPMHLLSEGETDETLEQERMKYDQYIANVDDEFGVLLDHLEETGALENSYLVVTSDHGEMFERGVKGHLTPLLYESVVRVPLLISAPGQKTGRTFYSPTSSVDILPTLLHATGQNIPAWAEGRLLPGFGGEEDSQREVYMLEAKSSSAFGALNKATFAMRKGKYKIILYHGIELLGGDVFELYDIENDPDEMDDLFTEEIPIAEEMKAQILSKFNEINRQMEGKGA